MKPSPVLNLKLRNEVPMKKCTILLFFVSLLVSSPVMAEGFINGRELLDYCLQAQDKARTANHDAGRCFGFISGVTDLYDILISEAIVKPTYCPPHNVSLIQTVNVVVEYLQKHPEDLQYSASSLVMGAYAEAFPCAQTQSVK